MLICQPPAFEMIARPDCCRGAVPDGLPLPPPAVKVRCASGLTIGDLLDMKEVFARDHKLCPYARSCHINTKTGLVEAGCSFTSTLSLRTDDPILEYFDEEDAYRGCGPSPSLPPIRRSTEELEIDDYILAKQDGMPVSSA